MNMSQHMPEPWSSGKTLLTPITKRWSKQQWDQNEIDEGKRIFSNFRVEDQGRSRQLIAVLDVLDRGVNWEANRDRIVTCVIALAGMTAAEIDTMIQRWKERN